MKIVVLAGGLSPERNVSLSSGAMVCEALRSKGHQVALVDLFFGMEGTDQTVDPFQAPIPQAFKRVSPQAPDLEQVRASRSDRSPSLIGPGVLELCAGADVVYLALHGACGEDGRIQAALDLLGVPYTGSNCLSSAIAMDKDMTKRLVADQCAPPLADGDRHSGQSGRPDGGDRPSRGGKAHCQRLLHRRDHRPHPGGAAPGPGGERPFGRTHGPGAVHQGA